MVRRMKGWPKQLRYFQICERYCTQSTSLERNQSSQPYVHVYPTPSLPRTPSDHQVLINLSLWPFHPVVTWQLTSKMAALTSQLALCPKPNPISKPTRVHSPDWLIYRLLCLGFDLPADKSLPDFRQNIAVAALLFWASATGFLFRCPGEFSASASDWYWPCIGWPE